MDALDGRVLVDFAMLALPAALQVKRTLVRRFTPWDDVTSGVSPLLPIPLNKWINNVRSMHLISIDIFF